MRKRNRFGIQVAGREGNDQNKPQDDGHDQAHREHCPEPIPLSVFRKTNMGRKKGKVTQAAS